VQTRQSFPQEPAAQTSLLGQVRPRDKGVKQKVFGGVSLFFRHPKNDGSSAKDRDFFSFCQEECSTEAGLKLSVPDGQQG
jgi:hypothetical protein